MYFDFDLFIQQEDSITVENQNGNESRGIL